MTGAVIDCKTLAAALRAVKPAAITSRSPLPICSGVRLAWEGDRLTVETTSLDHSITMNVALVEGGKPGSTIVPIVALQQALKFRSGLVQLDASDTGDLVLGNYWSRYSMKGMPRLDWPRIDEPEGKSTTVTAAMAKAIKQVQCAASRSDSRPILTGIHFDGEGFIVAADSYRLAYAGPFEPLPKMLVPADKLVGALGVGSEVAYDETLRKVMIVTGEKETIVKTIDGVYPNWRQLDFATAPHVLRFSRAGAIAALNRAVVATRGDWTTPVKISRSPGRIGFQFRVENHYDGGLDERVVGVGRLPFEIAFNPRYLREGVEACTGASVELLVVDALKPAKLVDGSFNYLIMPVRLP